MLQMVYDFRFSLTTFSPSGKLVQIEHALAAVGQGTTSLGIKGEFRSIHPFSAVGRWTGEEDEDEEGHKSYDDVSSGQLDAAIERVAGVARWWPSFRKVVLFHRQELTCAFSPRLENSHEWNHPRNFSQVSLSFSR